MGGDEARARRLAEALRENLKRRKAQARSRRADAADPAAGADGNGADGDGADDAAPGSDAPAAAHAPERALGIPPAAGAAAGPSATDADSDGQG